MKKTKTVAAVLVVLAIQAHGCTLICVGRHATADGSTIVAHTDDAGGIAADIRLINVPAMDHQIGSQRAVYEFASGYPRVVTNDRGPYYKPVKQQVLSQPLGFIPQVPHTYAYFDQDYGLVNEVQLAMVESTCSAKTVGWAKNVPHGYNMFGITELSKVALERCDNARCAIKLMGQLAEEYGFYSEDSGNPNKPGYGDSSEALGISDKYGEVWIFHVLTGINNSSAIWAAQRVPDDEVTVVANGFIIRGMNLSDPDNFLASEGMEQIAIDMGWWNPKEGPFDFTAAYGYSSYGPQPALYVGRRVWRVFDLVAPSLELNSTWGWFPQTPTYPFSVKPDNPISVNQVLSILGDYYQGTPYDMSKGLASGPFGSPIRYNGPSHGVIGGWERPISMFRTMFSFVVSSHRDFPDSIGCVVWYGQGTPAEAVYVPFSCSQKSVPESYLLGKESKLISGSAWWAFKFINNWSQLRYDLINQEVQSARDNLQAKAFAFRENLLQKAEEYPTNSAEVVEYLEVQFNQFAQNVVSSWWDLAWDLVGKYSDGFVTDGESNGDMWSPGYPKWWLEATNFAGWPHNSLNPPVYQENQSELILIPDVVPQVQNRNIFLYWSQYKYFILWASLGLGVVFTFAIVTRMFKVQCRNQKTKLQFNSQGNDLDEPLQRA
eukprot:TRINITY_DN99696_c0_g2_i3.p1 TRINITY_DN99696_c0_g2~~TRINITY_DN99696_c0_g2_i3.p1  ORF type:complete len:660 (-),score=67.25 TRINITY_DN99696_c0_g2_i3:159-2138(-)